MTESHFAGQTAYNLGYQAGRYGVTHCPFKDGTEDHKEWKKGFEEGRAFTASLN